MGLLHEPVHLLMGGVHALNHGLLPSGECFEIAGFHKSWMGLEVLRMVARAAPRTEGSAMRVGPISATRSELAERVGTVGARFDSRIYFTGSRTGALGKPVQDVSYDFRREAGGTHMPSASSRLDVIRVLGDLRRRSCGSSSRREVGLEVMAGAMGRTAGAGDADRWSREADRSEPPVETGGGRNSPG